MLLNFKQKLLMPQESQCVAHGGGGGGDVVPSLKFVIFFTQSQFEA